MLYGFFYASIMRIAHRYHWHYAPPVYPDGDTELWCQWCGFRQIIEHKDNESSKKIHTGKEHLEHLEQQRAIEDSYWKPIVKERDARIESLQTELMRERGAHVLLKDLCGSVLAKTIADYEEKLAKSKKR